MYLFGHRGVPTEHRKRINSAKEPQHLTPEEPMWIPLRDMGREIDPLPPRQDVLAGQIIGSGTRVGVAPMTGIFQRYSEVEHPIEGHLSCALVDGIHRSRTVREKRERAEFSAEELIALARDAAIIDEYDGLPLYEKLRDFLRNKVKLLVANAVDDEPYVSSGISTVLYYGKEVAGGMGLIQSILPRAATSLLAVFAPSSIHGMSRITEHKLKVKVKKLNGNYPLWIGLDRWLAKEEKTVGKVGVQACRALYRAAYYEEAQTECIVTVDGEGVATVGNFSVPVGMTLSDLLQKCGLQKNARQVILGNPMTGIAVTNLQIPITQTTRSVIVLTTEHPGGKKSYPCLGCGRCNSVCPVKLYPGVVAKRWERGQAKNLENYHIEKCIGCGCCTVVCPAGRDLCTMMQKLQSNDPDPIQLYEKE